MVTFISVFLGLILGVQPVEWTVSDDIANEVFVVELRLDGRSVGRLNGPPWVLACDFGPELSPHQLELIAYDDRGREISRAVQALNLPQPRSRAELVVTEDTEPRRAGVVWSSADAARPDAWQLRFNGDPLEVADPSSFELPAFDDEQVQMLQAELRFGRSWARTERVLGGRVGDQIDTELTGFLLRAERGGAPSLDELQGWLLKDGLPLEVVSVERAGSDIVVVQEATPWLWGRLNKLRSQALDTRNRNFMSYRLTSGLNDDDRLRVMLPLAERVEGAAMDQFHISFDFARLGSGPTSMGATRRAVAMPMAQGVVATFPYPAEGALRDDAPRRVAEAVAVAGQVASAGGRTRAVVLIKDPATEDHSVLSPALVRRYLERLQVPLKVWSPEVSANGQDPWGDVWEISTSRRLQRAVLDLRKTLDSQWMVWVRGRHLSHQIELDSALDSRFSSGGVGSGSSVEGLSDGDLAHGLEPWSEEDGWGTGNEVEPELEEKQALSSLPRDALDSTDPEASGPPATSRAAPSSVAEPPEDVDSGSTIYGDPTTLAETVEVRLINVVAVVTDADGSRVQDLTAEDFELRVDGQPVEIQHFVPPPAIGFEEGQASSDDSTPDGEGASSVGQSARWVVFFDAARLGVAGRREMVDALRGLVDGDELSQETMLVTYDGVLKIQLPFTTDAEAFSELLDRLRSGELLRSPQSDERTRLANEMPRVEDALLSAHDAITRQMAAAERDALLARLSAVAKVETAENRAAMDALRRLTTGLATVEGRKVLLYVGDGLELKPAFELYDEAIETLQLDPLEIANLRAEGEMFHSHREFESLLEEARGAGATYYSLTPKTRARLDVVSRGNISSTRPGAQGRLPSVRQELVKGAVCSLASESGGLCQVGGSQPELLLARALDDASAAYTFAFTPPHPADGAMHTLDIQVDNLEVRHPRGYVDRGSVDQIHHRLSAALYFRSQDNPLAAVLGMGELGSTTSEGLTLVPMDITVSVNRLGLLPVEQNPEQLVADARLLVTTRHESGAVTGVQEYPITFQVPAERLKQPQPLAYAHKVHLMLAPGEHTVAIGLWDDVSSLGSFLSREVVVP